MHKCTFIGGDNDHDLPPQPTIQNVSSSGSLRRLLAAVIVGSLVALSWVAILDTSRSYGSLMPKLMARNGASSSSVVLMVSFPNSGTTYTINNTRVMTSMTTATSYQLEVHYPGEPLFVGEPYKSPYLHNRSLGRPRYYLTKTHCGFFSIGDVPELNPPLFESNCLSIYVQQNRTSEGGYVRYKDLPAKAIHLIRDPHDNLVARMHFHIRYLKLNYTNNEAGFQEWCKWADTIPQADIKALVQSQYNLSADLVNNLPCISVWWRYVEWHNNAVAMLNSHDFPVLTLYYEDYSLHYQSTIDSLLAFVEQEAVLPPMPFIANKTYHSYFNTESKQLAAEFVRRVATSDCWKLLERYFLE